MLLLRAVYQLFAWSNLGAVLAIKGAGLLQAMNFTGIPLIIGLVIVSCIVNIFIGSASAKWAILAPVMVPMMMILGYDPAVTQVAYRIGDSITNPLSPLFYYFPLILGFVRRYEKIRAWERLSRTCCLIPLLSLPRGLFCWQYGSCLTCRWGRAAASICRN